MFLIYFCQFLVKAAQTAESWALGKIDQFLIEAET